MIEVLKQALTDAKRNERHNNVAETRYWLNQYKLIAEQAIKELESQDDSYCQACDGALCTAKKGCVALSNPPQRTEQEPVSTLWQHGETGRFRVTTPDSITDCDARWFKVGDLYTHPPQRTEQNFCPRCGKRTNDIHTCTPPQGIYYTPSQRKPLTDEECDDLWDMQVIHITDRVSAKQFIRDIEAAHGIKE